MVNPKISVIVPVYNGERYLDKCLDSIFDSDYKNFEVIVVNDASTDGSLELAKRFPCRIISLEKNLGVACARNKGADGASGDLLVFFDSDIVIESDTLSRFAKKHEDPNVKICHCQLSCESLTEGFVPDLIAITWNYYNWLMANGSSFIPTEAFSIDKKVFSEIGGFNTSFKSAGGEEFEIGPAIERCGYKIHSDLSFDVHHHFQKFWPRCKTLLRRSSVYGRIVLQRNFPSLRSGNFVRDGNSAKRNLRLDKGHGTIREGVNAMLAMSGVLSLTISIFIRPLLFLFLATLVAQVAIDRGLALYIIRKKGFTFFIRAIPINYIWYFVMGLGVSKAALEHIWKQH